MTNYVVYPASEGQPNGINRPYQSIYDILKWRAANTDCPFCQGPVGWDEEVYLFGKNCNRVGHRLCYERPIRALVNNLKIALKNPKAEKRQEITEQLRVMSAWLSGRATNEQLNAAYNLAKDDLQLVPTGAFINN